MDEFSTKFPSVVTDMNYVPCRQGSLDEYRGFIREVSKKFIGNTTESFATNLDYFANYPDQTADVRLIMYDFILCNMDVWANRGDDTKDIMNLIISKSIQSFKILNMYTAEDLMHVS